MPKKPTLILVICLTLNQLLAQQSPAPDVKMDHEILGTEDMGNFELTSGYYPIQGNIDNPECVFFFSESPSMEEYFNFARGVAAYFFIIHQGKAVISQIVVMPKKDGAETTLYYNVQNPVTGETINVECGVSGDIAEKRAEELLQLEIDKDMEIVDLPTGGQGLLFQGIPYPIQSYDALKAEVTELAKRLMAPQLKPIENPEMFIRAESIGGKLDFAKVLEKEERKTFAYEGVTYSKKDFAIFLWGQAVKQLGIQSTERAVQLWEEIQGRKLTGPEEQALTKGFGNM